MARLQCRTFPSESNSAMESLTASKVLIHSRAACFKAFRVSLSTFSRRFFSRAVSTTWDSR